MLNVSTKLSGTKQLKRPSHHVRQFARTPHARCSKSKTPVPTARLSHAHPRPPQARSAPAASPQLARRKPTACPSHASRASGAMAVVRSSSFTISLLICRERQVSLREWLGNKAQDRYSILVVHLSIVICEDYMYAVSWSFVHTWTRYPLPSRRLRWASRRRRQ